MRVAAKSPIEVESRLRTGEVLRSRRCEGPHLAWPCSRARMRPPSPLRSRPDPGCHDIRHVTQGFGQEPAFGRRLLAKALWGHSDCLEIGTRLDVSVTAAVGAGRSVDVGGAALERRSLEWRGTKPALCLNRTLRQRPTLSTPQCPRVSRRPSPHAHIQNRPPREDAPPTAAIRPARTPHSQFEPCPSFLGIQECPH